LRGDDTGEEREPDQAVALEFREAVGGIVDLHAQRLPGDANPCPMRRFNW